MAFELPLFTALTEKMRWHESRQRLLAENVANAETPGYRGRDLRVFNFDDHMSRLALAGVGTSRTDTRHIAVHSSNVAAGFEGQQANSFEITPGGNGVSLEDEMIKVTTNQMDYQAVTSLYSRSLKLMRSALGR